MKKIVDGCEHHERFYLRDMRVYLVLYITTITMIQSKALMERFVYRILSGSVVIKRAMRLKRDVEETVC